MPDKLHVNDLVTVNKYYTEDDDGNLVEHYAYGGLARIEGFTTDGSIIIRFVVGENARGKYMFNNRVEFTFYEDIKLFTE